MSEAPTQNQTQREPYWTDFLIEKTLQSQSLITTALNRGGGVSTARNCIANRETASTMNAPRATPKHGLLCQGKRTARSSTGVLSMRGPLS